MQTDVYNLENKVVEKTELPEGVFGAKWRPALVAQVLRAQLANRRRPWAHAKTRAEVRGGGRKPWRQKGTGRARHGSIRSPLWVGGGKSHGPNKERDYSQKINKKMRNQALASVLSKKFKDGNVKVFSSLELETPKTKILAAALRKILAVPAKDKRYDVLLVAGEGNRSITRAASNLQKTKAVHANSLNIYDTANYKSVFVEKEALATIGKRYNR
ncbi:MAG: 50S ribosomal protein L4 [Patescibacteria group bacterium]